MYNLLIALAIGAAAFGLGMIVAGNWIAGFAPAVLAAGIAYFLLARRTGKQFEAVLTEAMASLQVSMPAAQSYSARSRILEEARQKLLSALPLGRWQFLVTSQIHAQIGTLYYIEQEYAKARPHLEQAWSRMWQSKAMLAAIDYRQGHKAEAVERFAKLTSPGGSDPTFWMLYAVIAHRAGDDKTALEAISQGTSKHEKSERLKKIADQIRNKKKVTPEIFGEAWLQFFPEDAPQVMRANPELAARMGGQRPAAANNQQPWQRPKNRAQRRAEKRQKGKQSKGRKKDGFDHPSY